MQMNHSLWLAMRSGELHLATSQMKTVARARSLVETAPPSDAERAEATRSKAKPREGRRKYAKPRRSWAKRNEVRPSGKPSVVERRRAIRRD